MKPSIRIILFLLIILGANSCFPNKKLAENKSIILPLSDTVPLTEGSIVYALPRTIFKVTVKVERTIEKPGPYARYAGDLLGLDNVIQNESETWEIAGITVNGFQELDPSEFYVIESNTLFQTNVLALKKEGLILDIDPGIFYNSDNQSGVNEQEYSKLRSYDLGSDEYFQVQSDTAYKRVKIDSTFMRIPYIVEKKKRLTIDQLAEKAAKRLMEMRDGKYLILTGEANVFPQSEAPIAEMNRLEKEYTELFTGKTWTETRTFSYNIIPEAGMEGKPFTLFRFSELTGPAAFTANGGTPVTVELTPEKKTKDLTIISRKQADAEAPVYDKLFYRVPDVVNMKISKGSDILFNSRRLIYQFGEVIQLPANYIIGK
jgi:hypothetical protein